MRSRELLLISPAFHSYWRSVMEAFERRDYRVDAHVYDAHDLFTSVRRKVTRELPAKIGIPPGPDRARTDAAVAQLRAHPDAAVIVIKGDCLGAAFWIELSRRPRSVLWMYDEIRRTGHTQQMFQSAEAIVSYSPHDVQSLVAQGFRAIHVANAYDQNVTARNTDPIDGVVFVGARYPNREELLRTLMASDIPVHAYGRDWSDTAFDRARTWRLRKVGIPNGRELRRPAAYGVMAAADATLNTHFDQDGFTMRTFEAPGVGAVQLIDRPDVARYYEPGTEIAVFTSPEEAVELAQRAQRDTIWANKIREQGRKRTLAEHTFDHRVAAVEELWS